jgi:hypothetical protein
MTGKLIVIAGFPACKKTTLSGLLLKMGYVDKIFDGDWGRDVIKGHKVVAPVRSVRQPELGEVIGRCVRALMPMTKVGLGLSNGFNSESWAPFAEQQQRIDRKLFLYYDTEMFDKRWVYDAVHDKAAAYRRDDINYKRLLDASKKWDGWLRWAQKKQFEMLDVSDYLKMSELTVLAKLIASGSPLTKPVLETGNGKMPSGVKDAVKQ